jgi:hypothetical protein
MTLRNGAVEELARQTAPPEDNADLVGESGESRGAAPSKKKARAPKDGAQKKDRKTEGGKLTVRPDILWRLHIWSKERGVSMKSIADSILDRTVPRYEVKRIGKAPEADDE